MSIRNYFENMDGVSLIMGIFLSLGIVFGIYCAEVAILMCIWNFVVVPLFSLPLIPFWSMFWIFFALNIIGSTFRGAKTSSQLFQSFQQF